VRSGTLDDKLLREVCRPKSGAESVAAASKTAEKVSEAAGELRKANEALVQKDKKRDAKQPASQTPAAVRHQPPAKPVAVATPEAPKPRVVVRHRPAPAVEHEAERYAHAQIPWSYEGEAGPDNWGKLKSEYATCANGNRQSPIDIRDGIRVDLEPIQFTYRASQFRVVDNGYTVQVAVAGSSISLLGKAYELVEFHFHQPSEERVNGKAFDMVVHLVHKAEDGKLAIVAVLLEKGQDNPLIQSVWNNLPLEKNEDVTPPATTLDIAQLLPKNRSYYTYMGSRTTPPCSEGVLWLVLKQAQQISPEQLAIFARLYKNNARPVQPSFARMIKESR
jgi:carbonic anhydrase